MTIFKTNKAFTLIELLIVIAIIGILSAIILANLTQAKAKSRDAKRISEIANLQIALELFSDRCSRYPKIGANNMPDITDNCSASGSTVILSNFIPKIPVSPASGYDYKYGVDVDNDAHDYVLLAPLETYNSVLSDDVEGSPYGGINCTDDATHFNYCVQPR